MPVTPDAVRAPTPGDFVRLILTAAIWGSSFLCIAIALEDFAPVAIAGYRVALAALAVLLLCAAKGLRATLDRHTVFMFFAIGLLNGAAPFTLIGWGQLSVDSSTTAVLIAASPFATLLFSHFMTRDDRFTWSKLAGLLTGFAGVLVLLYRGLIDGGGSLPGMFAIALAAICYALSALLIRRVRNVPSLVIVAGQLLASTVLLMPFVIWWHPPWSIEATPRSLAAVVFLALGPTAIAYTLRTGIVRTNGAVFMSAAGYLIPVFAMFWAWLFLDEQADVTITLALLLILTGLLIGRRVTVNPSSGSVA